MLTTDFHAANEAGKPLTTVWDCVETFVSLWREENDVFDRKSGHRWVCAETNRFTHKVQLHFQNKGRWKAVHILWLFVTLSNDWSYLKLINYVQSGENSEGPEVIV